MYKGFIFLALTLALTGCASHRSVQLGWEGDRVKINVTPPGGSTLFSDPSLECISCSQVIPPIPLSENNEGVAYVKIESASSNVASRFRFKSAGADTTLTLQPRDPVSEASYYHLGIPIVGRIMVTEFTHIYKDSTESVVVGTLGRGDEANLFRENDVFYFIHHPMYDHPVVVLRSSAIRLH
ncbi:MAG TPA: hypothetical protein VEW28_05240 [Candidatus Kapabacteria bacterium]|nr:hypothetical protein [Candidatus Kapabacteria bacterium]